MNVVILYTMCNDLVRVTFSHSHKVVIFGSNT